MFLMFDWATVESALQETTRDLALPTLLLIEHLVPRSHFHSLWKIVKVLTIGRCGRDVCAEIRCAASPASIPRGPSPTIVKKSVGL